MDGLLTLVNDRNRRVLRLVKDPKEWLGLIHWRGNRKVTLHLDQPVSGSASSVNLGRVELSLQQTVVRHATTNTSLLAMIHDAVSSEFLEFKAHASADQYTEVELAWFGIDPTSVPAIRAFRDASDNDGLRYERAALRDNRYGCVVLSFPLSTLFSGTPEPSLWQLGERQYTRELSQTVLLDPTGGPVAVYRQGNDWAIIGNQRLTLLSCVDVTIATDQRWPYDIHYQPERWTHPEFAVQGGFRIRPDQGLRITFEPHGTGVCVKEKRGRTCHDCERRVKKTAQQARDDFLATVREGGLAAVMDVLQFLRAWPTAFTDADRAVLEAAMLPPLLREEEAPAQ
ncbi:uncharacterized protein ACA1_339380 [Acanthamoeba castellanii str. Neff]|uniref:Uncharacterized protein n=1 Tax=Acanthamoeba castellanii (strain ATCC 30010 / Neff) TaxID=1257118 RepID=L8HC02_ACACF|nr:uncharacterized protein ACA1_339380 [Acanthamoeba castellanii str. Neff]ELR22715.1 hypothetical protein ACA1_339380 [Acanthamoeba castellanii str. Neff]